MRSPVCALICLLGALMARPCEARPNDVARFAIVIGNNQPEERTGSVLRYADDDAVATHRLLIQAGVDSTLLVKLDDDSQLLYSDLGPHGVPRSSELDSAFARVFDKIRKRGEPRGELLIFYSGHGDVDHGEGYVVLEDGRLTRSKLYSLLAQSPAAQNHVFVDACKSYYLAFNKGPGGHRARYKQAFAGETVPTELANTGFVLSTSSDGDSHEWEHFQAGILSHELRSALRGAADVNRDGRVTYAELGAFLTAANQSIPNVRFRPDFTVRPPGHDLGRDVLSWTTEAPALSLGGSAIGHVYVETARGERVLDAHPANQQLLLLHVPSDRPLFVRRSDETAEYVVTGHEPIQVERLAVVTPEIGRRGALHLAFEKLFAAPFGDADVRLFAQKSREMPVADVNSSTGTTRERVATAAGIITIGSAAIGLTLGAISAARYWSGAGASQVELDNRNRQVRTLNIAAITCFAVAGLSGLTWGWAKLWPGTEVSIGTGDMRGWNGAMLDVKQSF